MKQRKKDFSQNQSKGGLRFINGMERAMRFIPSPINIFLWAILFISVIAMLINQFGGEIINSSTGEQIVVNNPISKEGIQWFLNNFVNNITSFRAFGPVLVMMLAVGTCEQCGFMGVLIKKVTQSVPPKLVPLTICFIGVIGNALGDSAIFVLTPLAGFAYLAIGRSPLLGMMTAYVANVNGMSANFILANTDVLTTEITNSALSAADMDLQLNVTCNWYFFTTSAVVLTIMMYLISEKIFAKVFDKPSQNLIQELGISVEKISPNENAGLKKAGVAFLFFAAIIVLGAVTGVLLDSEGTISPILNNLPVIFFFLILVLTMVYGRAVGNISSLDDVVKMMKTAVSKISSYIILVIVLSQFIALFSWTQLANALTVCGASFLTSINMTGIGLILIFMLVVSFVNLFMNSMSAMYSIFAPVAVPIFSHLGWNPALTQAAFRVADSASNVMSPVSVYLYMTLDIARDTFRADEQDCSVGKWLSCLIPASLITIFVWVSLLLIWVALDIPLGPGVGVYL